MQLVQNEVLKQMNELNYVQVGINSGCYQEL